MQLDSFSIQRKQKYSTFKWLTMLFMFLYISTIYYLSYSTKYNIISKVLFVGLLILTFLRLIVENKRIRLDWVGFSLILFLIWVLITNIWVVSGSGVKEFTRTLAQLVLLFFVIRLNINSEKDFRVVLWAMFVGTVVMCLYTVSIYGIKGVVSLLSTGGRLGKEVNQANIMGLYCDILCVMSLYFIYWEKKKWAYAVLVLSVFTLIGTGSRRSFLIAALLFFILFVFKKEKGRLKRALIVLGIVGALVYMIFKLAETNIYFFRISQTFEIFNDNEDVLTDGSILTRLSFFELAFELFLQKPLFGHGSVQFEYYYSIRTGFRRPPHSTFMQVLVGYGLLGFCIFYGMYVYSLIKLVPMVLAKRKYSIMILTMALVMLVSDIGTNMLNGKMTYIMLAIYTAYISIKLDDELLPKGEENEKSIRGV